jgi:iron complex outermembrane receptor protein
MGVDWQGTYQLAKWLQAEGNITWSRNRILNYTDYTPDYDVDGNLIGQKEQNYRSTPMSFSPDWVGSMSLHINPSKQHQISLITKGVSDQFMDNTGNKNRKINGYLVQDLRWIWNLPSKKFGDINLIFQLNNVWNQLYETNGYTYSYIYDGTLITENFFFPMAGTNGMIGVNIRL